MYTRTLFVMVFVFGNGLAVIPLPASPNNAQPQLGLLMYFLSEVELLTGSRFCTVYITLPNSVKVDDGTKWNLILDDLPDQVILTLDKRTFQRQKYNKTEYVFRHSQACSLVLHDYNDGTELPTNFSKSIPGGIFGSYHIFLNEKAAHKNPSANGVSTSLEMRYFGIYTFNKNPNGQQASELFNPKPNWNLRPLVMTIDQDSGRKDITFFNTFGKWNSFIVPNIYYLAKYMNATPVFNNIKGMPIRGQLKSVGWDGFMYPLINGTAHCTIIEPSFYPPDSVYVSKPLFFTEFVFLAPLPKERDPSSYEILLIPFSTDIWFAILSSILGMFFVLLMSIILSLIKKKQLFTVRLVMEHSSAAFLRAFKSVLDQPGLDNDVVKVLEGLNGWRVLTIWSFGSMILCNLYKSEVISGVVKPYLVYPPRNFDELMKSDFKINAILYEGNADKVFQMDNNSISKFILSRAKDSGFPEGMATCFESILQWDSVCLGPTIVLNSLVHMYMTDADGKTMFRVSDDSIIPFMATFGVSKYFPEVTESLNNILDLLEPSGLHSYWLDIKRQEHKVNGQRRSKKLEKRTKTRTEISFSFKILSLIIKVSGTGYALSFALFLLELLILTLQNGQRMVTKLNT